MRTLPDESEPPLRPGDWFTTNDEMLDEPSFLRDPEETLHRLHDLSQRPPHGMPMQVIVIYESFVYASSMGPNGQPWCPIIVDRRQHRITRLPAWVSERINQHLRPPHGPATPNPSRIQARNRNQNQSRNQNRNQNRNHGQDQHRDPTQNRFQNQNPNQHQNRHQPSADGRPEAHPSSPESTASGSDNESFDWRQILEQHLGGKSGGGGATPRPKTPTTMPSAGAIAIPNHPSNDPPWLDLRLRVHPRAALRDLARFGRWIAGLLRRSPKVRPGPEPGTTTPPGSPRPAAAD